MTGLEKFMEMAAKNKPKSGLDKFMEMAQARNYYEANSPTVFLQPNGQTKYTNPTDRLQFAGKNLLPKNYAPIEPQGGRPVIQRPSVPNHRGGRVLPTVRPMSESAKQAASDFGKRVQSTVAGGFKGSAAGYTAAVSSVTGKQSDEIVSGVIRDAQRNIHEWRAAMNRQIADGRIKPGDEYYKEYLNLIATAQDKIDLYSKGLEGNQKTRDEILSVASDINKSSQADIAIAKEGLDKTGTAFVDIGVGLTQLAPDIAIAYATGGSALLTMAPRAYGSGYLEAKENGASDKDAAAFGVASAAVEVMTEKISSSALPFSKAFGKGSIDNIVKKAINRLTNSEAGRSALEYLASATGEGIEEIVSYAANPILQSMYNGKSVGKNYSEASVEEALYQGILGFAVGGIAGVPTAVTNTYRGIKTDIADKKTGVEFKTQLGAEYDAALDELIATGKEFAPKSAARVTAETVESKIAKGKEISAGELGRLWRVNTLAQQEQAAAYFNGDAPKNPNIGNIPTRAQLDDYAVKKQQYAYAVKMGETLRDYGIKNVVIEDMAEGANARWENGTVYVSSRLDTAQAINTKVAHEISHAAKEGDAAFSRDITAAMNESGIDVEAIVEKKISTYKDFFKKQGKSTEWIEKNINRDYAMDEVAADYIGELMQNDSALRSLSRKPGLVGRIINAIERLTKGKSMVEQSEYHRLANRLREIAGVGMVPKGQVASGDGVRYDFENTFTPEVLKQNINEVASMKPVADIDMNGFQKGEIDLVTQVENFFNQIGNKALNSQIGEVLLERRGAKSDIAHGIGRKKAASFAAVPNVIEQGKIVDYQQNWKNRHYDSAVVAAPVTIGNETYIEGVVVTRNDGENRFYLHEVFIEKEDTSSFKTGTNQKASVPGDKASSLYILLKKVADVKGNMSEENSNTKFSVEDELTGEGGTDIIGSTQSAIETVRQMHREGKTPNEIFNATNKVVMANGDIYSGIGGTLEGNVNENGVNVKQVGMDGVDGNQIHPSDKRGQNTGIQVGRYPVDERDTRNGRRPGWKNLSKTEQSATVKIVEKYFLNPTAEADMVLRKVFNGSLVDMAEAIYSDYVKSPIIVEQKWNNYVPNLNEMLSEFDEIAGDNARYSLDDPEFLQKLADMDGYYELLKKTASPTDSGAEEVIDSLVSTQYNRPKQPLTQKAKDSWYRVKQLMVDSGEAVGRIGKETGDKYLYAYYNMARASTNAGVSMVVDAQTDISGKRVGDSLNDIFEPIKAKGDEYYKQFELYMWHLHNVDRMSRESDSTKALTKAAFEEYKRSHTELSNLADYQIKELAYGNDILADSARNYIQLLEAMQKAANTVNKPVFGYNIASADFSHSTAENLLRQHPEFEKLAQQVYGYIDNLMQYRVDSGLITEEDRQSLKNIYPHYVPTYRVSKEEAKRQELFQTVQVKKTTGRATGGEESLLPLHQALARQTMSVVREGSKNRFGVRLMDKAEKAKGHIYETTEYQSDFHENTFDELQNTAPQKTNTFVVRDGGKMWEMHVSPAVYEAVKAISPEPETIHALTNIARKANNLYKELITGYNPVFLARNFLKDLQDAGFYSQNLTEFAKKYPAAWKEIATNGKYWQQYKAMGGTYSTIFDYNSANVDKGNALKRNTLGRIETLNQAVEQAPRLAEFMATLENGDGSFDNLMEAMHAAADITVNFGRSGRLGKWLNSSLVPFLNPGIQGFDKIVRTVTETKGLVPWLKLTAKAAVFGILPRIISGLIYGDDDEWEDLKDRDKDLYYLFKLGDGKWLKLPKGRTFAAMSLTGSLIYDIVTGKEVQFGNYFKEVANQVAPANPLENNILKAWFDTDLFDPKSPGKTWYGGDIESQRLQNYAPGERYDEKTDALSKWLGGTFNLSPKKINYLLDQYTGVVGDFLLPLMTPQAERDPFTNAFSLDSVSSNRLNEEFYEVKDELTYAKNTDGASGADTATQRFWNKQSSLVSDVNAAIREIESDPELSDSEKKELVAAQKKIRNGIEKTALERLDAYKAAAEQYYEEASDMDEDARTDYTYRMANRDVYGAEYALQVYNKDIYEKAQTANAEGVKYDDFYDLYFDMLKAGKNKSDGGTETTRKRAVMLESGISQENKESLYLLLIDDEPTTKDKIDACTGAGLEFDDFLTVSNMYSRINDTEGLKLKQKAAGFLTELVQSGYSSEQVSKMGEAFQFHTGMSYTGVLEDYNAITGSGLQADTATQVLDAVAVLEPLPGAEQVSDEQKMSAVAALDMNEAERLKAMSALVKDETYVKLSAGAKFGVSVGSYAQFRETLPLYNSDGNGSYKQAEVTAALQSMSGLSNEKKAALWQLANTSWKPYRNPFGSAIGAQVKAELEESTAVTGSTALDKFMAAATGRKTSTQITTEEQKSSAGDEALKKFLEAAQGMK